MGVSKKDTYVDYVDTSSPVTCQCVDFLAPLKSKMRGLKKIKRRIGLGMFAWIFSRPRKLRSGFRDVSVDGIRNFVKFGLS